MLGDVLSLGGAKDRDHLNSGHMNVFKRFNTALNSLTGTFDMVCDCGYRSRTYLRHDMCSFMIANHLSVLDSNIIHRLELLLDWRMVSRDHIIATDW